MVKLTKDGLKAAAEEIRDLRLEDEKAEREVVSVLSGVLPNDRYEILNCYGKMAYLAQRAIFVYQTFCAPGERDQYLVDYLADIHRTLIEALEFLNGKKIKGAPISKGVGG